MYCPRCGQQQASDDMKFCSRCGLPIGGLPSWVASASVHEETRLVLASAKRKGITRGAKLMFLSAVLIPFCLFLSFLFEEPAPLLLPVAIFIVGLSLMLYARIFGDEVPQLKGYEAPGSRFGSSFVPTGLPEAPPLMTTRVNAQKVRTSELAQPSSVTEHTTKLLDND